MVATAYSLCNSATRSKCHNGTGILIYTRCSNESLCRRSIERFGRRRERVRATPAQESAAQATLEGATNIHVCLVTITGEERELRTCLIFEGNWERLFSFAVRRAYPSKDGRLKDVRVSWHAIFVSGGDPSTYILFFDRRARIALWGVAGQSLSKYSLPQYGLSKRSAEDNAFDNDNGSLRTAAKLSCISFE